MEDRYSDLIKEISNLPRVSASEDFSDRVMKQVLAVRPTVLDRIRAILLRPRHNALVDPRGIVSSPKTKAECSFSFILTAAFYLVIGVVLMSGLKASASDLTLNEWIRTQPQFIILSAIWLFGLGMIILFDGRLALIGAKGGTLLFVLATLVHSLLYTASPSLPAKYMSILLSTTATLIGILLYYNVSGFSKSRTKAAGTLRHPFKNA